MYLKTKITRTPENCFVVEISTVPDVWRLYRHRDGAVRRFNSREEAQAAADRIFTPAANTAAAEQSEAASC